MMRYFYTGSLFLAMIIVCLGSVHITFAEENDTKSDKKIVVNVDRQKLSAVENNKLVYEFDVVTGRPGKETEAGKYKTNSKYEDYTSKKYGSPMPYTMFFSQDGKAIHGTKLATVRSYLHMYITESVGSQGCVGLTEDDAKALFDWAPIGTSILIYEGRPHEGERLKRYK